MRTVTTTKTESTRSFTPVRSQSVPGTVSPLLQRKCACGNSAGLTGTCSKCQSKNLALQRRSPHQNQGSEIPPIVHDVLRSPGQSLEPDTRSFMESRFKHNFSQVRVHTDGKAAESGIFRKAGS